MGLLGLDRLFSSDQQGEFTSKQNRELMALVLETVGRRTAIVGLLLWLSG